MRQPSSSCSIRLQINTAPFHHALRRVGLLLCGPSSRSPTPWVVGLAPIRYPRRACIVSPPVSSWPMAKAEQRSPFAPAPLQGLPRHYGLLRLRSASVLSPSRLEPLAASPFTPAA